MNLITRNNTDLRAASVVGMKAIFADRDELSLGLAESFPQLRQYDPGWDFDVLGNHQRMVVNARLTNEELALLAPKQAERQEADIERFLYVKRKLRGVVESGLQSVLLPNTELPRLLMATPVMYTSMPTFKRNGEPVAPDIMGLASLLPSEQWQLGVQVFNGPNARGIHDYEGDTMGTATTRTLAIASRTFDMVTLATNYFHALDMRRETEYDPFILGTIFGFPFTFLLGRFSDEPLEHVDTMTHRTVQFLGQSGSRLSQRGSRRDLLYMTGQYATNRAQVLWDTVRAIVQAYQNQSLFEWFGTANLRLHEVSRSQQMFLPQTT